MCVAALPAIATAPALATATTIAGTAITAYGMYQQGKARKAEAEYNAQASENDAQRVRNKGTEEENRLRQQTRLLRAEQESRFGAGNIQLDSGSAADILSDTDKYGNADALTIRNNTDYAYQAQMDDAAAGRIAGANYYSAGQIGAFTSLLQGASTVSSQWKQRQRYVN